MNKSEVLHNTDVCKTCGKCCLSFTFYYDNEIGIYERLKLIAHPDIEVKKDGFYPDGTQRIAITIKSGCRMLVNTKDGYICRKYGKVRPLLCEQYPYKESNDCPAYQPKTDELSEPRKEKD